ncbi:MAG: hypothetical protein ACK5MT_04915 [Actinomycetales bacterium]
MGYGAWNDDLYRAQASYRRQRREDDFGYSRQMLTKPRRQWRAAAELSPRGLQARQARDSAEHPRSTPIAVFFDVTGSMRRVPRLLQSRLSDLHALLVTVGVEDPQLLFGAVGDEEFDRVPLQIGQFESDNRMDDQLRQILLEGGGGGDKCESYALATYAMLAHTETDHWTRRGRKGHLFLIGDELNKPRLSARALREVFDQAPRPEFDGLDIPTLYRYAQQRWHVHFVLPRGTSYFDDPQVNAHWHGLLGDRFHKLDEPELICELIAAMVGLTQRQESARPVIGIGA